MARDVNRLIALFARAETEITKSLAAALTRGATGTAAYRRQRQIEIKGILASLLELAVAGNPEDPAGVAWDVVRSAYRTGSERAQEAPGVDARAPLVGIHLDTARTLFEALVGRLQDAINYVGRRIDDAFREVTLAETLQGAIQGTTRQEQSAAIVEGLEDRGIKAFRDRAGREWSLANYAAMAARTTAREAHTRGTTTRLAENGLDLVKISEHAHELDMCSPHEGKIYSISGTHPDYPPALGNLPPYHPNCVHVATPYVARFDLDVKPEPVEEGGSEPVAGIPARALEDYPNLADLGPLRIEEYENPVVRGHVDDLSKIPSSIARAVNAKGLQDIHIAPRSVPELDDNGHVKGVRPRGWPEGMTWDVVPGAYNPAARSVSAGWTENGHGGISLALHEYGHGVDHMLRLGRTPNFTDLHRRGFDEIFNPYYRQDGPAGAAGVSEMIAEGFACWVLGDDRTARLKLGATITEGLFSLFDRLESELQ